jgi:RHS repeat-associated protein
LTTIVVTTPDGSVNAVPILNGASVNARGQRIAAGLGNGTALKFDYANDTYRLAAQTATRGASIFQQLVYVYDAVGNLVRATDAAQEGAGSIITGVTVPARRDYSYDAHYRLRQATGRVHQALLMNDFVPGAPGTFKGTRHIGLNNGAAVERFTRSYDYDKSGNLLFEKHAGASQSWTRNMWVSPTSNRSIPALDLNGNPIPNPEPLFDGAGNLKSLAHLRSIAWTWRNGLERAVVIARQGGVDDGEAYIYGTDALRARKVATRLVTAGIVEVTDTAYFNDIERKRITRNGVIVLERWSIRVNDGHARVAIIHRWTKDDAARETDDIGQARIRYQLATHQASVAIELDDASRLISYEEYLPYGGTAFIAGDNQREVGLKDYRYSGQVADDVTGLYSYGFRYYASWMCRWLSPDPSGPSDDLNLYQFALGDPVRNVDSDGLDTSTGKVQYIDRVAAPLPANPTDDQVIAAERESLSPETQALFDSLSRADQLRFAGSPGLALVPKDLDHLDAGGKLISRAEFFRTYLPKAVAWAKKHHTNAGIERPAQAPADQEKDDDEGGVGDPNATGGTTGGPDPQGSGSGGQGKTEGEGSGSTGTGTADGAGGTGTATGTGTGTGPGTTNAGDGNGTSGTGTSSTSVNPGNGAGANGGGTSGGQGSGTGGGQSGPGKGKTRIPGAGTGTGGNGVPGSGGGSEFGVEKGGREDGVLGGTPFSTGNSLDNLGDPISNGSNSNGSDKDGLVSAAHRGRGGGGVSPDGEVGKGNGSGAGKGRGRGTPTGSGGPPGTNNHGSLTGTTAANPNANANATGHGNGDGSGTHATGDTGATATILKIAGYANLEFGDGDANGEAGGIPGGQGKFKGAFWQFLYVVVTVIDTIMIVKSIIKSVATGALRRMINALHSPRAWIQAFRAFLTEGGSAWRKQWGSGIRAGLGQLWRGTKSLVWEKGFVRFFRGARAGTVRTIAEEADAIIKARNKSFWFKPRWYGRAGDGLYSTEHIIPKSWAANRPWLRPFVQSYANTFLRLPSATNTALGNRVIPKAVFYYGAGRALVRSWQFGWWAGEKILNDAAQPATVAKPER